MKRLRRVPRRLWKKLDEVSPTLNRDEQNVTLEAMRGSALATVDFYALMLLSSSIAFLGLRQNSSAVVIGAMLIAPMMSPMMAMGFGLVTGYPRLFRRAALSTLMGVLTAVGTSALLAFLIPSKVPTAEVLARAQPNLLDLMVALVSGAAGAYALCRKELAASLPGVAIAVALVPPLCVVGYGLGARRFDISQGAGLLFATNLASIVLAGIAVFWLLGFRPLNKASLPSFRRSLRWSVFGVLVLTLPLGYVSYLQIREANRQAAVERILTTGLDPSALELEDIRIASSEDGYVVSFTAYVYAEREEEANVAEIQRRLERAVGGPVILRARVVPSDLRSFPARVPHRSSARQ